MNPFKTLLVVLICGIQASCAVQGVQQLNELPKAQSGFIKSSPTVLVNYVDNNEVKSGFIGQVQTFQVNPGTHTVLVEYSDLYQINADQHEKVVSRPAKVTFTVAAGKTYQIKNPPQKDLEQAREFTEKPQFFVTEVSSGTEVESTVELSRPRTFMTTLKSAVAPVYEFPSDQIQPADKSPPLPSALEAMQTLWQEASEAERESFMEWVAGQK